MRGRTGLPNLQAHAAAVRRVHSLELLLKGMPADE